MARISGAQPGGSGGGGVQSVNGDAGPDVVLDASDVGADPAGTAAAAVAAHEAAPDPHPQYTDSAEASAAAPVQSVNTQTGDVVLDAGDVGADPAGTAAAEVAAHEAALDPHPQYTDASEAAAAAPVQSVNAETGDVVLDAGDVGADPAGTATAAVAAHEAAPDPHPQYLLADGTRPLAGSLDLDGNDLINGGTVTADLAGDVNGVTITDAGSQSDSLRADGSYQPVQLYGSTVTAPVVMLLPIVITGSAFIPIIASTTTGVLDAGTYELHWYSALMPGNANGSASARVQADFGGGLAPFSDIIGYDAGAAAGESIITAEPIQFTLGAPQSVSFQVEARENGAGTWTNQRTQFYVVRVS